MLPFATNASRPPALFFTGVGLGVALEGVDVALVGSVGVGVVPALSPDEPELQPAAATNASIAIVVPERSFTRRTLSVARAGGWLCAVDALRLFAAVDPPPDVCAQLSGALPAADERLRYVTPAQWHLTLAFYGSVAATKIDALRDGLERAASRSRPLRLRLAGAGTFPRRAAKARVLWVGLDGDVDELRRLADRCAGAGRRARIAMEARSFRPHLTVAQARQGAVDVSDTVDALAPLTSEWWTVDVVRLVHSTLGAKVHHETLARFSLERATHQA
jgi:RNA 2',3'-cyclic 3'-phosphodiesterase